MLFTDSGSDNNRQSPTAAEVQCDEISSPDEPADVFVDRLDRGQVGCFREGIHEATGVIGLAEPEVTLTSYPSERATLAGRLVINRKADRATIENLDLDGSSASAPSPTVNADDAVFRGNDVTNRHTKICFVLGDDSYGRADRTLIENNRIHNCGRLPATNHDHGIYVAHASGTVIRDNLIYDNADRGVQLYPNADDSLVTGNVIDGNGEGLIISGSDDRESENNLIEHNLVTNSTIRYNVESHWPGSVGNGNIVRENCVFGGARDDGDGAIETPAEGFEAYDNLIADPLYVDPDAGDYALEEDSPCSELGA